MKILLLIALFATATFAQSQKCSRLVNEEVEINFGYSRRSIEFNSGALAYKPANDHVTFGGGYTHWFGSKCQRGNVGLTTDIKFGLRLGEGSPTTKKFGRGGYKVVLQNNKPDKKVRPFVFAGAGWFRDNFNEYNCGTGPAGEIVCGGPETSETFNAGAGFDVGKGRKRFRTKFEFFTTSFGNKWQPNAEASVGIVF